MGEAGIQGGSGGGGNGEEGEGRGGARKETFKESVMGEAGIQGHLVRQMGIGR